MNREELNEKYFDWMCQLVCDEHISKKLYFSKLLRKLQDTEFSYTLPMDENRASDGTDLRYRFGYENDYDIRMVSSYLDDKPCSMLEMMVALAFRCEENIMDDPEIGNRTGDWFWEMVESLGLGDMTDAYYDEDEVNYILERFIEREYKPDGQGGLFTVRHPPRDMRNTEIWFQLCWYLDSIL